MDIQAIETLLALQGIGFRDNVLYKHSKPIAFSMLGNGVWLEYTSEPHYFLKARHNQLAWAYELGDEGFIPYPEKFSIDNLFVVLGNDWSILMDNEVYDASGIVQLSHEHATRASAIQTIHPMFWPELMAIYNKAKELICKTTNS